jgi:hypothetical protein
MPAMGALKIDLKLYSLKIPLTIFTLMIIILIKICKYFLKNVEINATKYKWPAHMQAILGNSFKFYMPCEPIPQGTLFQTHFMSLIHLVSMRAADPHWNTLVQRHVFKYSI